MAWLRIANMSGCRSRSDEDLEPVRGRWTLNLAGETAIGELGVRFVVGEEGERLDADALGEGLFVRNVGKWRPVSATRDE